MKKKKILIPTIVVVVVVIAYFLLSGSKQEAKEKYTLGEISRGDLEAVVSSTGALSAVTTVQVGTQVSGRIAKIYVDFNDKVKQGQLLAELDKSVWAQAVYDSETSSDRAQLQFDQAGVDLKRIKYLFDQQLKTQNDLDLAQYTYNVAKTNLKSAKSNLEKAKINLAYCMIYSPIDGTVINRKVDVGQTVAASFSSPLLFEIANDLKKMQIQANVDESDIGQIKEKQKTRFTVQAYPNRQFDGEVSQIRLQPTTIQNVVNYTVVVNVDNKDSVLLPGMTATIDFIIGQAKNVLRVPNAALRIRPNEEMQQLLKKEFESRFKGQASGQGGQPTSGSSGGQSSRDVPVGGQPAQGGPSGQSSRDGSSGQRQGGSDQQASGSRQGQGNSQGGFMQGMFGSGNGSQGNTRRREFGMLWYLDDSGNLKVAMVRTGLSDGQMTEVRSDKIKEGLKIIKSINEETAASAMGGRGMPRMF